MAGADVISLSTLQLLQLSSEGQGRTLRANSYFDILIGMIIYHLTISHICHPYFEWIEDGQGFQIQYLTLDT